MGDKIIGGRTYPERRVVRTGVSPMNPKVKWAELNCGHDVFRTRKPRIGALIVCDQCSRPLKAGQDSP